MNNYEHTRVDILSDTEFKVSRWHAAAGEVFTMHINGNASVMKILSVEKDRQEYERIYKLIGCKNSIVYADGRRIVLPSRAAIINELARSNKLLVWALTFTASTCRTEKPELPSYRRSSRQCDINLFK